MKPPEIGRNDPCPCGSGKKFKKYCEEDFFDMHVARLVAELAGLIRKYKGRFILSRDWRSLPNAELDRSYE
jgi:hypothetical protein